MDKLFSTIVALTVGEAGRYPDHQGCVTESGTRRKVAEGGTREKIKGTRRKEHGRTLGGFLMSAASEGWGPSVNTGSYSQGPSH